MDFSDEDIALDDVEEDVEMLRNLPLPQRGLNNRLAEAAAAASAALRRAEERHLQNATNGAIERYCLRRDPQNYQSPDIPSQSSSSRSVFRNNSSCSSSRSRQESSEEGGSFDDIGLEMEFPPRPNNVTQDIDLSSSPPVPTKLFEWPGDRPHPLLSSHIIRDIINNLGVKDVETCRKVCKEWNYEACKVLQEKKIVVLLEYDAVRFYIQCNQNTQYFPHTQFDLQLENINETHPLMKEFWSIFGSHIKSLDLRVNSLTLESLFRLLSDRLPCLERLSVKILPRSSIASVRRNSHPPHQQQGSSAAAAAAAALLLPTTASSNWMDHYANIIDNSLFPNIKELGFCVCPLEDGMAKGVIRDFFRSMPNIQKLSIVDIPSESSSVSASPSFLIESENSSKARLARYILSVLMENQIALNSLQEIDFPLRVSDNELLMLARNRFPLKSIVLILRSNTKSSALKDALLAMSPTLKKLEILFPEGYFVKGISFPPVLQMKPGEISAFLRNTRELTLRKFVGSLEYLQSIRTLKRLKFVDSIVEYQQQPKHYHSNHNEFHQSSGSRMFGFGMNSAATSTPAITMGEHSLEGYIVDSLMNTQSLLSVSNLFPKLRVLHLKGLNDEGLGIIYRNLPYLIELEVSDGKVTDQGISGVPMEVCVDMAETVMYNTVQPEKYRRDLFIGSLQYLSSLKISGDDVTDVSIAFGIVDCKNLTRLTLECSKVTDTGIIKIADRMYKQLKYLHIGFCEDVSEAGKFYAREKIKGVKIVVDRINFYNTIPDNSFRQIGFPYHVRHLESNSLRPNRVREMLVVFDDEYAFPVNQVRDRVMMAAMERRRRAFRLRQRRPADRIIVGGAPAAAAAAAAVVPDEQVRQEINRQMRDPYLPIRHNQLHEPPRPAAEQERDDEDDSDLSSASSDDEEVDEEDQVEDMDLADGLIGPGDLFEHGVDELENNNNNNDADDVRGAGAGAGAARRQHAANYDFPLGAEFPLDFEFDLDFGLLD